MTREEFVNKSREIYGNEFGYDSISEWNYQPYVNVPIYCKKHGLFFQSVYYHLNGDGCFKCKKEKE